MLKQISMILFFAIFLSFLLGGCSGKSSTVPVCPLTVTINGQAIDKDKIPGQSSDVVFTIDTSGFIGKQLSRKNVYFHFDHERVSPTQFGSSTAMVVVNKATAANNQYLSDALKDGKHRINLSFDNYWTGIDFCAVRYTVLNSFCSISVDPLHPYVSDALIANVEIRSKGDYELVYNPDGTGRQILKYFTNTGIYSIPLENIGVGDYALFVVPEEFMNMELGLGAQKCSYTFTVTR
jgi:hypothetical protein